MPDPINLRQFRKAKARSLRDEIAAQNRVEFGRTKAEKSLNDAQKDQAQRRLDGHKRDEGSSS